jgi:diadenosine tetraphosphate (Ap4A) HIT family hydrolase
MTFVNSDNTKHRPDGKYNNVINQIQKDGVCPFCPEQLEKYHKNPILKSGTFWVVTDNMYPYKGAQYHVLFIHKEHISNISELSSEALLELHKLINEHLKEKNIPGGTFMMRFGDTRYTGASVTHLHAHLISPDGTQKDREPILARVG